MVYFFVRECSTLMLEVNKKVNQITVNGMGPSRQHDFINPIISNAHILYPLKQKNLSFVMFSGGTIIVYWDQMG